MMRRDAPAALAYFEKAAELASEDAEIRFRLARALLVQGRLEDAEVQMRAARALAPKRADIRGGVALIDSLRRDHQQVRDEGRSLAPDRLLLLADIARNREEHALAARCYERAFTARPKETARHGVTAAREAVAAAFSAELSASRRRDLHLLAAGWLRTALLDARSGDASRDAAALHEVLDDPGFARTRAEALDVLPPELQPTWRSLWQDLRRRLDRADQR